MQLPEAVEILRGLRGSDIGPKAAEAKNIVLDSLETVLRERTDGLDGLVDQFVESVAGLRQRR